MESVTEEYASTPESGGATSPRGRRWYVGAILIILAVTAAGGALRFYHLSTPKSYIFDEVYYAKDGCFDAGFPYGESQFSSFNATCWATMALVLAVEPGQSGGVAAR